LYNSEIFYAFTQDILRSHLMTWVPEVLLILTIIFSVVPMNGSAAEISAKVPVLIGVIITIVIGEIVVRYAEHHQAQLENQTTKD
ncbi:MAG: hypothetical protein ACTIIZ_03595, partial [Levilactobacillus brevis]